MLIFPNLDAGKHRAAADPGHRRRAAGRADPDRPGQARACADALGDRARHRQHDRDRGRRSRRIGASFGHLYPKGEKISLTDAALGRQCHHVVMNRQCEGDATAGRWEGRQKDGVAMTPPDNKE